jgi:hypothetical protein
VKRKIPSLCRESNPDRPASSLVAIPTELSRLLDEKGKEIKQFRRLAILLRIPEIPGSNFGPETDYLRNFRDFNQVICVNKC